MRININIGSIYLTDKTMNALEQGLEKVLNDSSAKLSQEQIKDNSISEELTKDKLISIVRLQDGEELVGALMNGPIEVRKSIKTAIGSTSKVEQIVHLGDTFHISTESGSEYRFEPDKSVKIPDTLKAKW